MSSVSASCIKRTSSSVTMRVSWTPSSSSFMYRANMTVGGSTQTYIWGTGLTGTATHDFTFNGLISNANISWSVLIYYYDTSAGQWKPGTVSDSGTIMTWNSAPSVSNASYSNGSVTVNWSQPLGGGASPVSATIYIEKGSKSYTQAVTASSSNTTTITTGTLEAGTWHVSVESQNTAARYDKGYSSSNSGTFMVEEPYLKWSWTRASGSYNASLGNATYSQVAAAYSAVTGHGNISDFNHTVFNDMCSWVNYILSKAGSLWSSLYASYSSTLTTSSSKVLTAVRWNSLAYNVQRACTAMGRTTSFTARARGDKVSGSFFTALVSNLNSAINDS